MRVYWRKLSGMTKTQAVAVFGSQAELARALDLTRAAVSRWPEELEERIADRIRGAAVRLGKPLPDAVRLPAAAEQGQA
jgi:hypothetical protein